MPKRRASFGGSGGGVSVAAVALSGSAGAAETALPGAVEESPAQVAASAVALPPGFAERMRVPLSTEEVGHYQALIARQGGGEPLMPEDAGRYIEYAVRREAPIFNRIASPSFQEREEAYARIRQLRDDVFSDMPLAEEDRAFLESVFNQAEAQRRDRMAEELVFREGYQDRLTRPLSRSEEVPRFNQLWSRWQTWERGGDAPPLSAEEAGELEEYLERRMALPLRAAEAGSLEERRQALSQLEFRYGQLRDFLQATYPNSWEPLLARHTTNVNRVRNNILQAENWDQLNELDIVARGLEITRRDAMAAMSGTTDMDSLESSYRGFMEQLERFNSEYGNFQAESGLESNQGGPAENPVLREDTRRAVRLANEWMPRFEQELERRRRASRPS